MVHQRRSMPFTVILVPLLWAMFVDAATLTVTVPGTCPARHVTVTYTPTVTVYPSGSPLVTSPDGSCGAANGYTCVGDPYGGCCSYYGFCGWTDEYCGTGCQSQWGTCNSTILSLSVTGTSSSIPSGVSSLSQSPIGGSSLAYPSSSSSFTTATWTSISLPPATSSVFQTPTDPAAIDAAANSGAAFIIPVPIDIGGQKARRNTEKAFLDIGAPDSARLSTRSTVQTYIDCYGYLTSNQSQAASYQIVDSVLYACSLPISASLSATQIPFAGSETLQTTSITWLVSNGTLAWRNDVFDNGVARIYRSPPGRLDGAQVVIALRGAPPPDAAGVTPPAAVVGPAPAAATPPSPTLSVASSSTSSSGTSVTESSMDMGGSSTAVSLSDVTLSPSGTTSSSSIVASVVVSSSTITTIPSSAGVPSMSNPIATSSAPIVSSGSSSQSISITSMLSSVTSSGTTSILSSSIIGSMASMTTNVASSSTLPSSSTSSSLTVVAGASSSASGVAASSILGSSSMTGSTSSLGTNLPTVTAPSMGTASSVGTMSAIGTTSSTGTTFSMGTMSSIGTTSSVTTATSVVATSSSSSASSAIASSPGAVSQSSSAVTSSPTFGPTSSSVVSSAATSVTSSIASLSSPTVSSTTSAASVSLASSVLLTSTPSPTSNTVSIPSSQAASSAASSISAPQPTGNTIVCPDNNGTTFTSPCGSTYEVQCDVDHDGGDLSGTPIFVDTFAECIAACDARPECDDVAFRAAPQSAPCYLKGSVGFSVSSPGVWTGVRHTYGGQKCQVNPNGTTSAMSSTATSGTITPSPSSTSSASSALSSTTPSSSSTTSAMCMSTSISERGVVAFNDMMGDYQTFIQGCSNVSWYYNYDSQPFAQFEGTQLQYVPMLFTNNPINFTSIVLDLMSQGYNITHVLGFNEPDQPYKYGGSDLDPATAAAVWQQNIQPLAAHGIKLGAPAISYNVTWLTNFYQLCVNCTIDFIPFHWYGPIYSPVQGGGFYDRYYQLRDVFKGATFWITEWADSFADLATTQQQYQLLVKFFESQPDIERHAYFGSFRSNTSNVGTNATMLDECGRLTDIGDMYLNKTLQGNIPHSYPCGQAASSAVLPISTVSSAVASSMVLQSSAFSGAVPTASCLPGYQGNPDCIANPSSNNQVYVSSIGAEFSISCGINFAGNDMPNPNGAQTTSFGACMDSCGLRPGCAGAVWVPSDPNGTCFLKSAIGARQSVGSMNAMGAVLFTNGSCPGYTTRPYPSVAASSSIPSSSAAGSSSSNTLTSTSAPVSSSATPSSSVPTSGTAASSYTECYPSIISILHLPTPTPIDNCVNPNDADSHNDDVVSFTNPFPLTLYSTTSNVVFVTANGLLSLNNGSPSFATDYLPSSILPALTAAPFWYDLGIQDYDQGIWYYANSSIMMVEFRLSDPLVFTPPWVYYQFMVVYKTSTPGVVYYYYYDIPTNNDGINVEIGIQGSMTGPAVNFPDNMSLDKAKIQNGQMVTCDTTVAPNGTCVLGTFST